MWILDMLEKKSGSEDTAVIRSEETLSYRQLWERSEAAARYIKECCKTKNPVLIYGNKELEIPVLMAACLKTGRAYVPLDVTYPKDRILEIAKETGAELMFQCAGTGLELGEGIRGEGPERMEEIFSGACRGADVSREDWVQEEDNCYILFTSGSTGKAKGVQITKKNILNFTNWFSGECLKEGESQVVMNQVSYSFDVSVIPLYIFLGAGKTLYSIDKDMLEHTRLLFEYLSKSGIQVWVSTPAFLEMCCFDDSFEEKLLPDLRRIILAGEILTKKLVGELNRKFPKAQVVNGYGPTEGTVLLTSCQITKEMMEEDRMLPIGKLLPDGKYQIVDQEGREVKLGETGELVVSSESISRGYLKNPEQTAKVFFQDKEGRQSYRTGDLVYEHEGLLYYVARKDTQIKLNGYRIELNDVSENLNALDMVGSSVVLPVWKEERISYLAAFVTLKYRMEGMSDLKIGIELKKQLKAKIPSYMVPRKMILLDRFPMNINGKVDRKKLAEEYL